MAIQSHRTAHRTKEDVNGNLLDARLISLHAIAKAFNIAHGCLWTKRETKWIDRERIHKRFTAIQIFTKRTDGTSQQVYFLAERSPDFLPSQAGLPQNLIVFRSARSR
jgi:hypothetical protein